MTEPWDCPNGHPGQVGRYCEVDGYDSHLDAHLSAPVVGEKGWSITVAADREYYEVTRATTEDLSIDYPLFLPPRRFPLRGESVLVGRADVNRGIAPDIDLTGPPEDRAIGRAHAMFVPTGDGTWAVVDLRSTNRTYVNDCANPIPAEVPVELRDSDRVFLGAWTALTVHLVTEP
ncbi:FHA domain-containing protein [Actinokineospora auranticolor]|uniref:FHA domain-containing protein n=1 Tax=Actinokineospora auranticolor TaxID=155976 RepID=A0A2S6GMJ9_9PSEU|nr:FHA domain-containing protein [Actinokineospora auranticolor]PPK66386.1 FHA domain-containing protein [Actinokineospora auranticolor]